MRALQYILLCFGLSWGLALLAWLLGVRYGSYSGLALTALYMLMPATSVVLLQRFVYREPLSAVGLRLRATNWAWVLAAIPLSWAVTLGSLLIIALLGNLLGLPGFGAIDFSYEGFLSRINLFTQRSYGVEAGIDALPISPLLILLLSVLQGSIGGAVLNLPFVIGEELGWRGFLLRETAGMGDLAQTLVIGAVWGLWHAPLILQGHNYPGHPWGGVLMMMAFCTSISYPLARLARQGGSVIAPAVFHGVLNPIGMSAGLFIADANPLLGSVPGVAGILAGLLLTLGFVLSGPGPAKAQPTE